MKEYLDLIMDIGELMLLSGAEVHRVEDSMGRMFSSLGAERIDVFIITSSMIVTIHEGDDIITQTRRIFGIGNDIEKLHLLNQLSRNICKNRLSKEEIKDELAKIKNSKKYPLWIEILSYMFIAGSFAIFFGGDIPDALVALFIGALLRILVIPLEKASINKIFIKFICSFFVSILAFGAVKLGIIKNIDKVIIGNIMVLIPGAGLTNSLRDLFVGDSVSGLLRLIEAILTALAIAAGYFLFVFLSGGAPI